MSGTWSFVSRGTPRSQRVRDRAYICEARHPSVLVARCRCPAAGASIFSRLCNMRSSLCERVRFRHAMRVIGIAKVKRGYIPIFIFISLHIFKPFFLRST